jgi:hypothetical protein
MANDEPINTPAPVAEPTTPVAEPVQAPVAEAVVTPEPTLEAAPTPVPEAPKPDTLLGETTPELTPTTDEAAPVAPVEEVKPAEGEVPPTEGEQQVEGGQSDEPAPPPSYEAFKVPENVQLDGERITEFTGLLAKLELEGKADHAVVQQFGQEALDFHVSELQKQVEHIQKTQLETWEKTVLGWKDEFLNDPEIGGNRFQTTLDAANTFIKTHGGTPERQKEFRNLLNTSGLGNHPTMIRLLANAGTKMSEGRPLAATAPISAPKSKTATMYGPKE